MLPLCLLPNSAFLYRPPKYTKEGRLDVQPLIGQTGRDTTLIGRNVFQLEASPPPAVYNNTFLTFQSVLLIPSQSSDP